MLVVQEYLRSGKTFDDLAAELGIVVRPHDTMPLAIVNYDQLESPKTHPIVRECRGLVLHSQTFDIVARSFPRFFNWGEVQEEMGLFDFSDFVVQSKEDGSLCLIFYFDGRWHANTRGSFATDPITAGVSVTWREGFCKALGISDLQELSSSAIDLDKGLTYVCEFCSTWNKIVRRYEKPEMFLLTAFAGEQELHHSEVNLLTEGIFRRPTLYNFRSVEEIQAFLTTQAESDPTFEGVVICDCHGHRWKIKSATYLGLHRLRGEGDNLYSPKNLLPFIMSGEDDELLTYYPEVSEAYFKLKSELLEQYAALLELWADHKDIAEQKEFALRVKDHSLSSVLFQTRKKHPEGQLAKHVKDEWRKATGQILKVLKEGGSK